MLARIPADQLAGLLDISGDGIVTVDARQVVVAFNRGAANLFGYDPAEILGRPLDLLIPARFLAAHAGQVAGFGRAPEPARHMGERQEVFGVRKDGTEFPAEVSISKFGAGDRALFTAIVRDVTERKRYEAAARELDDLRTRTRVADAEAAARHSEALFRRIVETAHEGIWQLDPDARVVFVNDRMADLLGYRPDEVRGRQKWDFLFDEDRAAGRALFERRRAGVSEQADVRFRRRDGGEVWTLMSARPLTDAAGRFDGALDMFTDLTERRRAEDALRARTEELRATTQQLWQAAKLAGVGELAASIAHELNNPLATVSLRVERLLARTPADDPRRRQLEVIEQEIERMAGLVGNLLQFSRAGRDQVSTVDVPDEVVKTVDLVGHHLRKRQIRVEPEFAAGVPHIHADRQQLRQVFLNLFTNAADAMPAGGRLAPRVRPGRLPPDRPAVVVEVMDTGTGIPPELLGRVCEPFFTTKDEGKGTGLGLAICRRIVQQHHGTLEVESRPGQGTTVRLTLPVRPDTNVAGLHAE
ncbi:PAS domain-containing sensor histidine kinase [Urbifossiella limnaea]|uniref:PAS domain-containing sensor histidine kinase n=1 Tax=Urbifossiella limnaea TaxID=2528023 RepID=UPI00192E5E93|nr:PAS domain S-box protein [Urbifossiella limnaea]